MSEEPPRPRPPARATAPPGGAGSQPAALEVSDLRKSFGSLRALRGVSFAARPSELLAVVGPNGAGKTTLLSILGGIEHADGGEVSLRPGEVGWVPQHAALYRRLTVAENLRLFARLEKVEDVEGAVEGMLAQTGLADRRDDQVSNLSGGNQQRINIAIGLLGDPSVLLLDEPSAGLDPRQRVRMWELVAELAHAGTTVIYSTHQIEEASRYGDRMLVLADGEILFDGSFDELRRAAGRGGGDGDPEGDFVEFLEREGG